MFMANITKHKLLTARIKNSYMLKATKLQDVTIYTYFSKCPWSFVGIGSSRAEKYLTDSFVKYFF